MVPNERIHHYLKVCYEGRCYRPKYRSYHGKRTEMCIKRSENRCNVCITLTYLIITLSLTVRLWMRLISIVIKHNMARYHTIHSITCMFTHFTNSNSCNPAHSNPYIHTSHSAHVVISPLVSTSSTQECIHAHHPHNLTHARHFSHLDTHHLMHIYPYKVTFVRRPQFLDEIVMHHEKLSIRSIQAQLDWIEASVKAFQTEILKRLDMQAPVMPSYSTTHNAFEDPADRQKCSVATYTAK